MRKIGGTRAKSGRGYAVDADFDDRRPRGVAGAMVTAWAGDSMLNLSAILPCRSDGATISAASSAAEASRQRASEAVKTVSLSDGTRITFATAGQFTVAEFEQPTDS